MKKVTVLLSTGGHLSAQLPDDAVEVLERRVADGDVQWLGMPSTDGHIDIEHLVYVNLTHVVRVDIEDIG